MAQLRVMIAVALVAVPAPAAPPATSAVAAPKGWAADPALAKAAAAAIVDPKQSAISVTRSDAWSDPTRGCYGLVLDLRGAAGPIDAAADSLLAALGTELAGAKLHDVQKPVAGPSGTLALGFEVPRRGAGTYHGKLRAELASTGEVHALACVWNQREPKVCEAACTRWFGGGA
jgi:hypothetical protein